MALRTKVRAKSAKERRVMRDYLPDNDTGKSQEFIIGHYLESLRQSDKRVNLSKSNQENSKGISKLKIKKFASQPSLNDARPRPSHHLGKVANRTTQDMGAYAWTPLATRTAVGYDESPYAGGSSKMTSRPGSAPIHRMRRSGSLNSVDTASSLSLSASLVTSHASSRARSKRGYMEEHVTLCVRAFPNGTRERSVRVTSKTLAQLLEEATEKLRLPSAGRKIFLPDGTPVNFGHQLQKDCSVYISMGEPFKDPYEILRDKEKIRLSSSWTISGIMLPEEKSHPKKAKMSKRMKSLLENPKHRVLVFKNGESREGAEVVANRFDEFIIDCTRKLDLTSSARALFDWKGKEVQSFQDLYETSADGVIQTSYGVVLGPVWATKGEPFNPIGAYEYFMGLAIDLKRTLKQEQNNLENLQKMPSNKEENVKGEFGVKIEKEKEIERINGLLETFKKTLKEFKSRLRIIKENFRSETVPKPNESIRLFDTRGYRLKLRLNGAESSNAVLVPFSSKDLRKGRKTKEDVLQSFFDLLNGNQALKESFIGHGRRGEFKRAFLLNGAEIKDITEIGSDAEIWLSLGEDFVPIEYDILGLTTDQVRSIDYWNQKMILQRQSWLGADEKLAKLSLWTAISSVPIGDIERQLMSESFPEDEKLRLVGAMNDERLKNDGVFLQNKRDEKLVLYPELQLIRKGREQDSEFWGEDARQWVLSQDGTITNKCFRNLALSIRDQEIVIDNNGSKISGFAVALAMKKTTVISNRAEGDENQQPRVLVDPSQQWKLTPNGEIMSASSPNFFLTSLRDIQIEFPQPVDASKEMGETKMSSLSSSSDSESASINGEGDADKLKVKKKKMKRIKKDNKNEKEKKKWWNFGSSSSSSSSSSDSSDEDDVSKERKKSNEDIKVRMKGTSSEDDKLDIKKESEKEEINEENGDEKCDEKIEEKKTANDFIQEVPDVYGGEKFLLGVFGKFDDKNPLKIRQRWAVKMDDAASLMSSATLSDKWMRQGLAWPVNEADTWIEDNVSGYLLPCAPKLKRKLPNKEKQNSSLYGQPARLKVLRNGEHDSTRAMTRKVQASLPLKWKKSKGNFQHVQAASVTEVEFEQFLDKCTDSLGLPFAARRLFDEKGKELTSVNTLERDQLVYVSCGEQWIDPHVTYSEQQRRLLLANLASDVSRIRNYVMLREQSDFILNVEGPLQAGSKVVLTKRPRDCDVDADDDMESTLADELIQENEIRDLQRSYLTSHQIAHMKSEERLQSIRDRFQHESGMASDKSTIDEAEDESPFSNPALARKFSRSMDPPPKPPPNAYRQWVYNDGFIQLKANKKLVIGVQQNDESSSGQDVILCNKKLEDSLQRWIISDLGYVHLKCNPQLVFTVATPALQNDPFAESNISDGYDEKRIILCRRLHLYNANSHQMFDFENDTGFINAFSTDLSNTEVTAAMKASVCTYSIFGSRKINQPGYSVSEGAKSDNVLVCESCGKAVRGKLKLEKIQEYTEFACAMGSPEKYGVTTTGSFRCLSSQVDLSQKEAESTLLVWEMQLKRLQKESSVRVIAYELNLAKTAPAVRILAHKNGDIGYSDGVIVIANSINQFLDLCTYKLGLNQAARKLYTMNGELITDMNQLLQPYYPDLCLPMNKPCRNPTEQKGSAKDPKNRLENDKSWLDNGKTRPDIGETRPDIDGLVASTPKPNLDRTSAASDATFTIPSRDGTPSVQSTSSEKRVSFANFDMTEEEEEVDNGIPRIEKLDVRIPVDVWVSCGEPFIPFEDSEKIALRTSQDREERAKVADYLEQEKHRLRQLQGRRYAGRASTTGNGSAVKPVLKDVWNYPTKQEEMLEKSIEDLQLHLSELKTQQEQEHLTDINNPRPKSAKLFDRMKERKLYDLPRGLCVLVFPNGEHVSRAVPVVASNLTELLDRATSRLDLNSVARRVFNKDGDEIHDFDQIERNQLICVTCGERFVPNNERRQKIEMRASWSRSHRLSTHGSGQALALTGPQSPTVSRGSPVIRKSKHEETFHVFENSRNSRQESSDMRSSGTMTTPARPTSARPNSFSDQRMASSEKKGRLRPTTAHPNFVRSKPGVSSSSLENDNKSAKNSAPSRPFSARPTSARPTSARPTSARPTSARPTSAIRLSARQMSGPRKNSPILKSTASTVVEA